ncbi:MAG TPA: NAD(P)-dependent oxidoreductase [Candidatus Dormibacteraeota bacterium]
MLHRLLITGAAGSIGQALREGLRGDAEVLRLLDTQPLAALPGEEAIQADAADLEAMRAAMRGVDACVHLAAIPHEGPFLELLNPNYISTWCVLEAARLEGCRRVVFASSNHAQGFEPVPPPGTPPSWDHPRPMHPDTYYGVSKVFGEAMGSMFHDKFGLEVACLRIGSFLPKPTTPRNLATWLSPGDCVRLVRACLTAPDLGFRILPGISRNTRRWWHLAEAEALGYDPQDDAEEYVDQLDEAPVGDFQGGTLYTGPETTP